MMGLPAQPIMSQRISSARRKTMLGRSAARPGAPTSKRPMAAAMSRAIDRSLRRVQHEIVGRASPAVGVDHAAAGERDAIRMAGVAIEAARQSNNAACRKGDYLARFRDAVSIGVVPQREPVELATGELSVAIVVERGERVVPGLPEHPEGDRSEELQP